MPKPLNPAFILSLKSFFFSWFALLCYRISPSLLLIWTFKRKSNSLILGLNFYFLFKLKIISFFSRIDGLKYSSGYIIVFTNLWNFLIAYCIKSNLTTIKVLVSQKCGSLLCFHSRFLTSFYCILLVSETRSIVIWFMIIIKIFFWFLLTFDY